MALKVMTARNIYVLIIVLVKEKGIAYTVNASVKMDLLVQIAHIWPVPTHVQIMENVIKENVNVI